MACRAILSGELDPYWNLAAEEELLAEAQAERDPVLFLWRSRPAVIVGKNQNPWRECNLAWMQAQQVHLARRISGGGAVYHDLGNLNYAVFLPRSAYAPDAVYERTLKALQSLGIPAERLDRTSLAVDGWKVSGHAFCMRRNAVMHHGTLLFNADLKNLSRSLAVSPHWQFETKATESVRAKVANLSQWREDLTVAELQDALVRSWDCGTTVTEVKASWREESMRQRRAELCSDAWLFERTPEFWLTCHPSRGQFGETVRVRVQHGRVVEGASSWINRPVSEFLAAIA